jgi:tRNA A-37 threonylcarbamoyl transferase component Bud32/tetratricopeptide (TPR) repeat protein
LFRTQPSGPIVLHAPIPFPVSFPGYEILDEMGRGGMGVVYRARQTKLNRLVALKVIIAGPHASSEDKARFRLEAEAGARLRHPNIVQVYDVGEHAGFAYMALELVEGGTLRKWQAGKPVAPKLAVRIAAAIGLGIQHAHENGIIHRDLKPANILLGKEESLSSSTPLPAPVLPPASCPGPPSFVPKITDFGLAKSMNGEADLTVPGMACGTPNYMSPEQVRGGRRVGPGADVYGLGAVLFELLSGRPPFTGSDAAEVMEKILKYDPPSLRTIAPTIPRDLTVIVAKCLEKDPTRRYLTVREFVDDLGRFLEGVPIQARPARLPEKVWRWIGRNPLPSLFLGISACGCALTGWFAYALDQSVRVERAARAEAEIAQARAAAVQAEAERDRDKLGIALTAAQTQKSAAEAERKRAEEERHKAESNLRITRQVIRTTLTTFTRDVRFNGPSFRDYREKLITSVRRFRDEVAAQDGDSPEWLDDIADVSHWLGVLELLNGNHKVAAEEFQAAAAAARRWAALSPKEREPRTKLAESLANAGQAFTNTRAYNEAVAAYRESARTREQLLESTQDANDRRAAFEAWASLANLLRLAGSAPEQLAAAGTALTHARALALHATPDNRKLLAAAEVDFVAALLRLQLEISAPADDFPID